MKLEYSSQSTDYETTTVKPSYIHENKTDAGMYTQYHTTLTNYPVSE